MKLRFRKNSLRFRLDQKDLAELLEVGFVRCELQIGPDGAVFSYGVESHVERDFRLSFVGGRLTAFLPREDVEKWGSSEQVAFASQEKLISETPMKLLIEKDFHCLTPRAAEEDQDTFPNPHPPHQEGTCSLEDNDIG